jgi:hypothetical protein
MKEPVTYPAILEGRVDSTSLPNKSHINEKHECAHPAFFREVLRKHLGFHNGVFNSGDVETGKRSDGNGIAA